MAVLCWPVTQPRMARLRRRRGRVAGRRSAVPALAAVGIGTATVCSVPAGVAAALVVATAAVRGRQRSARRRRHSEAAALQAALDVLVGELRIGVHPVSAFDTAAGETSGPVGRAMGAVAARTRLGADVAGGLEAVAAGSPLPMHWHRLADCWRLAHTHGLSIATLMRAAQRDIVERERFSAHVEAAMAGPRATAAVLAALPVVGIALGQLIGAQPLAFLFGAGVGGWLLTVGTTLSCLGLLWSDQITTKALP